MLVLVVLGNAQDHPSRDHSRTAKIETSNYTPHKKSAIVGIGGWRWVFTRDSCRVLLRGWPTTAIVAQLRASGRRVAPRGLYILNRQLKIRLTVILANRGNKRKTVPIRGRLAGTNIGTFCFGYSVSLAILVRYETSTSASEAGSCWFESSRGRLGVHRRKPLSDSHLRPQVFVYPRLAAVLISYLEARFVADCGRSCP